MLCIIVLSSIWYSECVQFVIDRLGRLSRMSLTWHPDQLTSVSGGGATKAVISVKNYQCDFFGCLFFIWANNASCLIIYRVKQWIIWNVLRLTLFVTCMLLKISHLVSWGGATKALNGVKSDQSVWLLVYNIWIVWNVRKVTSFVENILNNAILEIGTTFVSLGSQIRTKGWVCWSI